MLYGAAFRRSRRDAALSGVRFTEGVKALAAANVQLMECAEVGLIYARRMIRQLLLVERVKDIVENISLEGAFLVSALQIS